MDKIFQNIMAGVNYGRSIDADLKDHERRECVIMKKYCLQVMRELRDIMRDAAEVMLKCPELRRSVSRLTNGGICCTVGGRVSFECDDFHIADCSFTVHHERDNVWAGAATKNLESSKYNFESIDQEIALLESAQFSFEEWAVKKSFVDKSHSAGFAITEALREAEKNYVNHVQSRFNSCCASAEHAEKQIKWTKKD